MLIEHPGTQAPAALPKLERLTAAAMLPGLYALLAPVPVGPTRANPIPAHWPLLQRTLRLARRAMSVPRRRSTPSGVRPHRHTPNTLRLIVDAVHGTYTVLDNQRTPCCR